MIETHPFEAFVPQNMQCLIVGSFPGREQTSVVPDGTHWFYGAKRNQFWKILEEVYGVELIDRQQKQKLFENVGIGIADIINHVYAPKPLTWMEISKLLNTTMKR